MKINKVDDYEDDNIEDEWGLKIRYQNWSNSEWIVKDVILWAELEMFCYLFIFC